MRIALVGTYPPRACGIATFTADVEAALAAHGVSVEVFPVEAVADAAGHVIGAVDRVSYRRTAAVIDDGGFDLVLIQHEFGIFGGSAGELLLELTDHLSVPYAVTLHTVLAEFDADQRRVIDRLCAGAVAATVFTATARRMLLDQHLGHPSRLHVVSHGAPVSLFEERDRGCARQAFGLDEDVPVVSTFGLLSPGKGIETAIRAVALLVDERPDLVYVIAGRTHPEVVHSDGEAYREELVRLVRELGIDHNVRMLDRFLSVDEIADLLAATDVFCTPYRNRDQVVSGALSFALASGCPVVSSPYLHAQDALSSGAGILVADEDPRAYAAALGKLLPGGARRAKAIEVAGTTARTLSWPSVARRLLSALCTALRDADSNEQGMSELTASALLGAGTPAALEAPTRALLDATPLALRRSPSLGLGLELDAVDAIDVAAAHLRVLCDDTAMLQHAAGTIPRLCEGYCVDDAGRALPILARLAEADHSWNVPLARLLAFLHEASIGGDGHLRNFLSWDRRWLDDAHGGDHAGRALWGLGELIENGSAFSAEAAELFTTLAPNVAVSPFAHTVAYGALGALAADAAGLKVATAIVEQLHGRVRTWHLRSTTWPWPHERLTYDNARLCEVMLRLGQRTGDNDLVDRGEHALRWLEGLCRQGDRYRVPGHLGLDDRRALAWSGSEQPLELTALADAASALWAVQANDWAPDVVARAWSWFNGNNRLGVSLGNAATGACMDGLDATAPNRNCGAESTLSFHRCAWSWRELSRRVRQEAAPRTGALRAPA